MDMAKIKSNLPKKSRDIPVTLGMLHMVRDELKSDIRSLEYKMDSRFKDVDSRFKQMDARFNQVDARFNRVDARFDKMDARFLEMDSRLSQMNSQMEKMMSQMHQMHSLAEEQNARNKVVMDGLISLFHRQDRCEERIDRVEQTLSGLGPLK